MANDTRQRKINWSHFETTLSPRSDTAVEPFTRRRRRRREERRKGRSGEGGVRRGRREDGGRREGRRRVGETGEGREEERMGREGVYERPSLKIIFLLSEEEREKRKKN